MTEREHKIDARFASLGELAGEEKSNNEISYKSLTKLYICVCVCCACARETQLEIELKINNSSTLRSTDAKQAWLATEMDREQKKEAKRVEFANAAAAFERFVTESGTLKCTHCNEIKVCLSDNI